MNQPVKTFLGLDIGSKWMGVARGNSLAKLATPFSLIAVDGQEIEKLRDIIKSEQANALILGLPRGLDGQETEQTKWVKNYATKLDVLGLPIYWQDEANTTNKAYEENPNKYNRVDDRAAAIILQDYLDQL